MLGDPATRSWFSWTARVNALPTFSFRDFVLDLETVLLRDDLHRHLAGSEAGHLDGPREALQARIDFLVDLRAGDRQVDAALKLSEGFRLAC